MEKREAHLRWRDYKSASGRRPVREFLMSVSDTDRASILAAMKEVGREGLTVARRVRGDLFEVRAAGLKAHYRLIFSHEAKFILLAIDIFDKDTQKTPETIVQRAEQRLRDWRARG